MIIEIFTGRVIKILKGILVVVLAVFLFLQIKQPSNSGTDFQTVVDVTLKEKNLDEFKQGDNLAIKRFLGMNPEEFESIVYYKNTDTMKASEVVIVKFKDNKQSSVFKDAMKSRIENQKNVFGGYIEEEEGYLNKAVIDIQANYALYAVGEDAQTLMKQFESAL